jgi:8-oxo-dGTP pyrophosphatase MutT (NUDIX family)
MRRTTSEPRLDYRNRFMDIVHTKADFGEFQKDYFVIELGPRAGIIAVRDGAVLLTRQYRFLIDAYSWEIPGGRVDEGETPEIAATRECLEETGIECSRLRKLVEYYPGLDNFNNRTTVFASGETRTVAQFIAEPSEVTEIRWFPLDAALKMVFAGEILDALTVTALLAYKTTTP